MSIYNNEPAIRALLAKCVEREESYFRPTDRYDPLRLLQQLRDIREAISLIVDELEGHE